jgi:hypothetical protein
MGWHGECRRVWLDTASSVSGFEEWEIGADGLITGSLGHFDEVHYRRQLEHGSGAARRSST